jgi:hypothetical protein
MSIILPQSKNWRWGVNSFWTSIPLMRKNPMKNARISKILFVLIFSLLFPFAVFAAPLAQVSPPGLTPDKISGTAAILLSLIFSYIPKLNNWYESLDNQPNRGAWKRLIMLACCWRQATLTDSHALAC